MIAGKHRLLFSFCAIHSGCYHHHMLTTNVLLEKAHVSHHLSPQKPFCSC